MNDSAPYSKRIVVVGSTVVSAMDIVAIEATKRPNSNLPGKPFTMIVLLFYIRILQLSKLRLGTFIWTVWQAGP